MTVSIEDLPAYLYCDECPHKHFLTLNKDIQSRWLGSYSAFLPDGEAVIEDLMVDEAPTLNDVARRMMAKLNAYNRTKKA